MWHIVSVNFINIGAESSLEVYIVFLDYTIQIQANTLKELRKQLTVYACHTQ